MDDQHHCQLHGRIISDLSQRASELASADGKAHDDCSVRPRRRRRRLEQSTLLLLVSDVGLCRRRRRRRVSDDVAAHASCTSSRQPLSSTQTHTRPLHVLSLTALSLFSEMYITYASNSNNIVRPHFEQYN